MKPDAKESPGTAVDSEGRAARDPSENVQALSEAANQRQDDLREAERRYNDLRAEHQKELADLRATNQQALDEKESARLDSIRQVDREDVAKTAAAANLAIATLAKQTTDLATTLQAQVGSTAAAAETRRSADMSEVNKRVSALELASSATAGKQLVADPMQKEMVDELKAMRLTLAGAQGKSDGLSRGGAIILSVAGFVATILTITSVLYAVLKK